MRFTLLLVLLTLRLTAICQTSQNLTSGTLDLPCNNWLSTPTSGSYVNVGDLDITGHTFTIEANINRTVPYTPGTGNDNDGDIISKHLDPSNTNYLLRANHGYITTTNGFFATPNICEFQLNKTYHLALVYDGSFLKFYRNGFLMSQTPATGELVQSNLPTRIGLYSGLVDETFKGFINEVRIWNVVRTQAEIRTYMNTSLPNPTTQTGLQAYYTFNNLLNKQGNPAWNGTLAGAATINATNTFCAMTIDSCGITPVVPVNVTASFNAPATVCVNTPVQVTNTSQNATNYFWSFCEGTFQSTPDAANLGNASGALSLPVFSDIVKDNSGNYFSFTVNNFPSGIVRYDYGNSLLNTPTVTSLGNPSGALPANAEGIQVVYANNKWRAVVVGGDPVSGNASALTTLDFGTSLTNAPTATNWGNLGGMSYPIDLYVFQENNNWYGYTVNFRNSTITKFNFGTNFAAPTGTNIGNIGSLTNPVGIGEIKDGSNWYLFVTNETNNTLTRLSFGTSLLNTPTGVNIGNPGNLFGKPRDISFIKLCSGISALTVNGTTDEISKLDFQNNILGTPTGTNLGNIGNLSFPHSISKLFRVNSDIYALVPNVTSNTMSRIRFAGCQTIPGSAQQNPGPITYTQPGTYNINLTVDIGLPTQTSFCRQIVVTSCQPAVTASFTAPATVCVNTPVQVTNTSSGATNYFWSFCETNFQTTPDATNLGNVGGSMSMPVFSDLVQDQNGDYYAFVTNHVPNGVIRYKYGSSYLNTPTVDYLGNFGNVLVLHPEDIKVVKAGNNWIAVVVGGNPDTELSKVTIINFGPNINNNTPVVNSYSNIGGMSFPLGLSVFFADGRWGGYAANTRNNTITKFDFGTDFSAPPTAVNLGNLGGLNIPTGIGEIKDNGNWHLFVANEGDNSITRLDFGSSLSNVPTAVNIPSPGGIIDHPRDISFIRLCNGVSAFVPNAGTTSVVRLDFGNNLLGTPVATDLGNIGNFSFPHSISNLFRVNNDIYTLITNVSNNTMTRLRFAGCQTIPGSSSQNPAPITYSQPGTYNINLTVDIGLPTQTSFCRQIVVNPCQPVVTPAFDAPLTVCVNTPVQVTNNSIGATNYFWSFCEANFQTAPTASNLGNIGGVLAKPVFSDLIKDAAGNYYAFVVNHEPAGITRYSYGNSYLNTPTVNFLGNPGNNLVNHPEGIKVVKAGANYVAVVVGGNPQTGDESKVSIINFGPNITNNAPVVTSFANVGGINFPIDLSLFFADGRWYAYTVNTGSNTLTKIDFGTDFTGTPTGVNLGNIGGLNIPTGIGEINNNGNWHLFITNEGDNSLTRLDFGVSLNTVPTAVNLPNPGGILSKPRDISFIKLCDGVTAFVPNGQTATIIKLDFGNSITNTPAATSLGNLGTLSFPHSISNLFRVDNDIYTLITNVDNNTISRLRFAGCQTIPGSSLQNPGSITYPQPGNYNINLTVDIGLPTQSSICRQIVVTPCASDTIVNDYTQAISLDVCKNILNVGDATKFNVGDTVMLIQMKGAIIDSTNTAAFGTVLNYRNAGNYEFNIIKNKNGGSLELLNTLTRQYDFFQGKVQLIRVPYFTNLSTDKKITCPAWDGNKGGVLVLNAAQSITMRADIDVSLKGFRGGTSGNNLTNAQACGANNYFYPSNSTLASPKGEGITSLMSDKIKGKGAYANGGGGGLDHNSGGAGGSNGGAGGNGGNQFGGCATPLANGGVGGRVLPQSNAANKIFMGGGGGSGHANNAAGFNPDGGNGGGIVIVNTPLLINNGFSITANGGVGPSCVTNSGNNSCNEGMGGGGAAGTVVLNVNTFANLSLNVEAKGAVGSNVNFYDPSVTYRYGPGGGGGGGSLWIKQSSIPSIVLPDLSGGLNGVNMQYAGDAWGATAGSAGTTTFNLVLPVDVIPFRQNIDSVRFASASGNCRSFNFNSTAYTNTSGITSWQWTFGDGGVANTQNTSHTYTAAGTYQVKLVVTDINGCKDSIVNPVTATVVTVDAGLDTAYCTNGNAVRTLHATGAGPWLWTPAAYLDNNTLQNPVATVNVTTKFYVTLTDAAGCSGTDSVTITVKPLPNVRTLPDSSICKGSPLVLTTTGASSYSWTPAAYVNNPSVASPSFIDANSQTLYVSGTGANGCIGKDTINITVKPLPVVTTIKDSTICSTASIVLATSGAQTYSWTPATALSSSTAQNPVLSGLQNTTTYIVTGTGANLCSAKDTVKIAIRSPFTFAPPPDKEVCLNQSVALDGNNGTNVTYSWSPAATLNNAGIINPVASPRSTQTYTVTITDAVCHYNTDFPVLVKVNPLPTIKASKSNDINCAITTAKLSAIGGSQYSWSPASTLTGANTATPIAKPNTTVLYTVLGTDLKGCKSTDTISVIVNKSSGNFSIPNTFTPNNDGKNECFGVKHWGDVTDLIFIIYNRFGEKVFETNNPNVCWDGRYKGQPADQGTYVYYIKGKVSCGELIQKGNVLLLR